VRGFVRTAIVTLLAVAPIALFAGTAQAATTAAQYHMTDPKTLVDSTGKNNGTTTAITSTTGSSGKGYSFNGTSSKAVAPNSASLNPGTANIKMTAHVQFTALPTETGVGDYDLMRKGQAGTIGGEYKMEILGGGNAYCHFQGASGAIGKVSATGNLADGAWHTITCTKTATQVKVTVDGVTRSVSASLGSISNNKDLYIGSQSGGGDWYKGAMDEVSIVVG
jgi:Concanavalin A-like lectin/glucanases superfamily